MTPEALADAVRVVLGDVHATSPVELAYTPLSSFDDGAAAGVEILHGVVHLSGSRPVPEWTGLAVSTDWTSTRVDWMVARGEPCGPWPAQPDSRNEVIAEATSRVQTLVQLRLFEMRLDPTWPPCPEHGGRHPLRTEMEWQGTSFEEAAATTVTWRCHQPVVHPDGDHETRWGPTAIPVGRLAEGLRDHRSR